MLLDTERARFGPPSAVARQLHSLTRSRCITALLGDPAAEESHTRGGGFARREQEVWKRSSTKSTEAMSVGPLRADNRQPQMLSEMTREQTKQTQRDQLYDSVPNLTNQKGSLRSSWSSGNDLSSNGKSSLGDAKSSLGDAESSLGDAESSLGDARSSLGDAESWVTLGGGGGTVQAVGDGRATSTAYGGGSRHGHPGWQSGR